MTLYLAFRLGLMSFFCLGQSSVIVEISKDIMYEPPIGFSDVDKVKLLFKIFDCYPKDGYLGYSELRLFQQLTDPQLPLDITTYRWVIALLGGSIRYGITLQEFNSSYYLYKNTMQTDLNRDFVKIQKIINNLF